MCTNCQCGTASATRLHTFTEVLHETSSVRGYSGTAQQFHHDPRLSITTCVWQSLFEPDYEKLDFGLIWLHPPGWTHFRQARVGPPSLSGDPEITGRGRGDAGRDDRVPP